MAQTIITRGKTVEQAIDRGLEILNKSIEDVDIEILDYGRKGFLSIGAVDAQVKLQTIENQNQSSVKDIEDYIDELDQEQEEPPIKKPLRNEENDGFVAVEDGKIIVQEGRNYFPSIKPGKGINLYINGDKVTKTSVVRESDEITYEAAEEIIEMDWEITKSEDLMQVRCYIKPERVISYELIDQKPNRSIELRTVRKETVVNQLEYSELISELEELGIIHGFSHSEINEACQTLEAKSLVLAKGTEPKSGEHGKLDFHINIEPQKGKPHMNDDGTVDFRETLYIPTVEKGDVIATIIPPVPGVPGKNVLGELVPPPISHPAIVKNGKGIEVVDEEKVVATESGKPHIQARGVLYKIEIMPKLTHRNDVSIETGNIRFHGDVEIYGKVEEEMAVDAVGEIEVHGSVDHANLTAGSSIYVRKNVIHSKLSAGNSNMLISNLGHLLTDLSNYLDNIILAIQQLIRSKAFKSSDFAEKGILPLLKILLEKKFKAAPQIMKEYIHQVDQNRHLLDKEWFELSQLLKEIVQYVQSDHFKNVSDIKQLKDLVETLREISDTPPEPNSKIVLPYAINSSIYSSGDITVVGDGSYHTTFYSGGTLIINKSMKGGVAYGQKGIEIGETGSKGGQLTQVSVSEQGYIKIGFVWQDTEIKIGSKKYHFYDQQENIYAVLENGEIAFK